jgi:SAM-dependent methyltransferase
MNTIEKANVLAYHRHLLHEPIEHFAKLGWCDSNSQQKRFEALTGLADLSNNVILDVGCGFGDLKPFLDHRFHDFVYLGIDHLPEFITEATRLHAHKPSTFFQAADFVTDGLPEVDYVLASGAFSYQTDNTIFLSRMIEKLYQVARKGLAFNLLDSETFRSGDLLKSYNRYEVLSFCLRLGNRVELVTGYLEDDFTIWMDK